MIALDDEHQERIDSARQRIEALAVDFERLTPFLNRAESLSLARSCIELASARNDLMKLAMPWDDERQSLAEAVEEAAVAALALLPIGPEGSVDDIDRLTGQAAYYSVCAKTELGLVCGGKLDPVGATHFLSAISLCRDRAVWAEQHDRGDVATAWLIMAASIYNRMSNDRNWPASITWRNALALSERAMACAASHAAGDLARARATTYASLLAGIDPDPSFGQRVKEYGGMKAELSATDLPLW